MSSAAGVSSLSLSKLANLDGKIGKLKRDLDQDLDLDHDLDLELADHSPKRRNQSTIVETITVTDADATPSPSLQLQPDLYFIKRLQAGENGCVYEARFGTMPQSAENIAVKASYRCNADTPGEVLAVWFLSFYF